MNSSHCLEDSHWCLLILFRLVEKLPQVVLGNEESRALSHVRKLLVVIYFSGPRFVVDFLCQSPVRRGTLFSYPVMVLNLSIR